LGEKRTREEAGKSENEITPAILLQLQEKVAKIVHVMRKESKKRKGGAEGGGERLRVR